MRNFLLILCIALQFTPVKSQKPELVIQSGHQSEIEMASISPDGRYLLSVEEDSKAILWETESGRQIIMFKEVMAAGFSSDGNSIEMVMDDYSFRKTDYSGKILYRYPSSDKGPDRAKRLMYTYYPDDGLFDWNGLIYHRDLGFQFRVDIPDYGLAHHYSSVLNQLVIGGRKTITFCNVPSGEIVQSFKLDFDENDELRFVRISPDGKWLAAGSKKDLFVVEIATGQVKHTFKYGDLTSSYRKFELINATFSSDSKNLLVLTPKQIILYEGATGNKIWETPQSGIMVNEYGSNCGVLGFSPDGKKVFLGGTKKIYTANATTGALETLFTGSSAAWLDQNFLVNNDQQLVVKSGRTNFVNWNLSSGAMEKTVPITSIDECINVSSDGKSFYIFPDRNFAKKLNASGEILKEYPTDVTANMPATIGQSYDGKYIATSGRFACDTCVSTWHESYNLYVYDAITGKKIIGRPGEAASSKFANNSNLLAIKDNFDKLPLRFIDIPTGKVVSEITLPQKSGYPSKMQFSSTDRYFVIHTTAINIVEMESKKIITIDNNLPDNSSCITARFSSDEKYYVMGSGNGKVFFYDIATGSYNTALTIDCSVSRVEGISFTKSDRFMFLNSEDNFIQVWDLSIRKLVATLYPNTNTNDWAVITPDGRFDASVDAQSYLFFRKDLDLFPLGALFEQFYTPALLPRILAGEVFPEVEVDFNKIKQAPVVKIRYQETDHRNLEVADDIATYINSTGLAEITVTASSKDDVIDEIRLFHNGKIVTLTTRNLIVEDESISREATKTYTITLLPGENKLRALALNSERTESKPSEISVIYRQDSPSVPVKPVIPGNSVIDLVDKSATLHLVVVGINQYQNPAMSLNYALADATAVKLELEKDVKSIISNINTHFVTDGQANKQGIQQAFAEVQKTAKATDVFIFYYAGHGVIGKDREFYLVPADVSDLKNVQTELEQKGIPSGLLQQYAIDIQAQKQLFILDACQSAGAFEAMLSNNGDQQKSIAVVARSTGTHWMAASGAQQYANEFSQLGHGAFTYVLLEALKGSAASDKMITVNGLKSYLQQGVPELMKKYSGTLQYPASYGFGNDFPVEIIK